MNNLPPGVTDGDIDEGFGLQGWEPDETEFRQSEPEELEELEQFPG